MLCTLWCTVLVDIDAVQFDIDADVPVGRRVFISASVITVDLCLEPSCSVITVQC